jgi:hypothetical protein
MLTPGLLLRFPPTTGIPNLNYILLHLPVVGKAGDIFIKDETVVRLIEVQCRWCGEIIYICQSCWRGQAYCSDECRIASKRKAHQEAQKRYRKTEKGKKAHCEAENRRRMGLSKKIKKNVDDRGSTLHYSYSKIATTTSFGNEEQIGSAVNSSLRFGRCHFCGSFGVIVDRFPRRGYGKQNYSVKIAFVTPEKG